MKIAIIGTGAYSSAIAEQLHKKNNNIIMWTESEERYKNYIKNGYITNTIENHSLPKDIKLTTSYEEAIKDSKIIFLVPAAAYVGKVCQDIKNIVTKDQIICIASKGIDNNKCEFLSDIVSNTLKTKKIANISGPSFAIDMIDKNPIGLSIASKSKKVIKAIKEVLANDTLKLRDTNDLIGLQICGSIKNVIAVASGILDGLGYPESTRSFLITESLHDIKELISKLGGNPKTILSFAGVGDLLLTCTSTKSRNFSFGRVLATNNKKEIAEYLNNNTVEGYYTLKSIYKLVKKKRIKMPIIDLIYDIVMNGKNPNKLGEFLINKK
jgi:glycerol-3-phosphate dehydrogenase (NAD(P)+)